MLCSEVLSEESMKPHKLRRHSELEHPKFSYESPKFFMNKSAQLETKARLDINGTFQTQSKAALMTSYFVSLRIAKAKKIK